MGYTWEPIHPEGFTSAMLGVTIMFTIVCLLILGIRVWIRVSDNTFQSEDFLMCTGVLLNMVHNACVIWGIYAGVGSRDSILTTGNMIEASKATVFWQIFYVSGSLLIKASICTQLAHVANERKYAIILYGLVAITAITTFVAILSVLIRCRPIKASWTGEGKCIDQGIIIALTYAVSAVNIVTDLGVSIVPVFILKGLQMRRKLKLMAGLVMGVGILASVATIIRLPYSSAYSAKHNALYGIGHIILWTVVECSLGIIAGCMPMLRKLFKNLANDSSRNGYDRQGDTNELVTVGQRATGRRDLTGIGATTFVKYDSDNTPQDGSDSGSTKQIIKVTRSVYQTSSNIDGPTAHV